MGELEERLRLQLRHRPGDWIAVVHGDPAEVRGAVARLRATDTLPVVVADRVPPALRASGRAVLVVPVDTPDLPRPPRLACRIGAPPPHDPTLPPPLDRPPPGSAVDPGPLLDAVSPDPGLSRADLGRLAAGARALVDRGWYADAVPFVERLRFEAYRAAALTWEDAALLDKVALVEELTARIALAHGDPSTALESWRTAWWLRTEIARVGGDPLGVDRPARHVAALEALLGASQPDGSQPAT